MLYLGVKEESLERSPRRINPKTFLIGYGTREVYLFLVKIAIEDEFKELRVGFDDIVLDFEFFSVFVIKMDFVGVVD